MNNLNGQFNVFVGDSSGINNSSGQRNTYVGSKARGNSAIRVNATAFGANAEAGADNVVVLGSINGINGATSSVNVGIGTITPSRRLYIQDGTSSGVNSSGNSLLVLDKTGGPNYLSILNGNTFESGLIFGRAGSNQPPFDGGIFYNVSNTPGGMQFRNKGGLTRMIIHDNGNISIGVNKDAYKLIVQDGTSSGITASANSSLILDKSGVPNYLSILNSNFESGVLFGIAGASIPSANGGILYNSPNTQQGFQFRTGGNATRMVVAGNGNIGVGTATPNFRLHVVTNDAQNFGYREGIMVENIATGTGNTGEAAISFKNAGPDGTGTNQWMVGLNQNRNLAFAYGADFAGGSVTKMLIDSTGNVGMGTTSPSQKLHVIGNILATGTVTPSDLRYKKNFSNFTAILPTLMAIRPMYYQYNKEAYPDMGFSDERTLGVIAQELEKSFPELVVTDQKGYKAVDYSRLSVVLLKAIQEQQQNLLHQEKIIDHQKELLEGMVKRLNKLETLLNK